MAVAVISEFNPFHNGHKYLLNKAKNTASEPVIAVMSGSFVQRGEVAICDKFARARAALQNGADLVLELPCVYSVATAARFAAAGTEIAQAFDSVGYLAFGCETDDIDLLLSAANSDKNDEIRSIIKNEMKSGGYYPRALENAVRAVMGDKTADVLTAPNNVLAVEYLRNISPKIKPMPIKRIGAEHDSSITRGRIASASHIRELLRSGEDAGSYMPTATGEITYPENLERILLYKLRSMTADEIALLPDVGEGLENRIFTAASKYNSVKEIINEIKTKRYTHARIRRIMICALLGITDKMQNLPIEYVYVLGFTNEGAKLLKHCQKKVITSAVNGLKLGGSTSILLEKDIYATDIAALAYNTPKSRGLDFITPIVKEK